MSKQPKFTNKFDNSEYSHMKMWPFLSRDTPDIRIINEYKKRSPFFISCYQRYGKYGAGVIRYIILVYDKQSPMRVIYPMLDQRKDECAALVGIYSSEFYPKIADFSDAFFVDALSDFLRMRDDIAWALIVQNEEVFHSNQRLILSQIRDTDKDIDRLKAAETQGKLLAMQNVIRRELKALYSDFTGNDPDAEAAIKDRRPFSPEVVSLLMEEEE